MICVTTALAALLAKATEAADADVIRARIAFLARGLEVAEADISLSLLVRERLLRNRPWQRQVIEFCGSGGDKGSRTPDLLNAIETLYQLSYIPMNRKRA